MPSFKKFGDKKVQKLESGFLEQGCVFLKVDLKQPEFLEFMENFDVIFLDGNFS